MMEEPGADLIEPGAISEGTLLRSDLLSKFWAEYERRYPEGTVLGRQSEYTALFEAWHDRAASEFRAAVNDGDLAEDAGYLLEEITADLDAVCYDQGLTFSAHPGDPACFGYWEWEEDDDEATG